MSQADPSPESLGGLLQAARVARGWSLESVARELKMAQHLLSAIEADDWARVPPGRERPLARLLAKHLGVDPEAHPDAWARVPGLAAQEAPDPRREKFERILTGAMGVGSVLVLLWLVVPGREIKESQGRPGPAERRDSAPWVPANTAEVPYPVLGEMLPEAPINAEGILVNVRAMDACTARITAEGANPTQALRVSEPWTLRVKGPFTLDLDNAGVVTLEVAGRRIAIGGGVGEVWSARFDEAGRRILPPKPEPDAPLHEPQSEPDTPPEE